MALTPKSTVIIRTNDTPLTLVTTPAGYATTCTRCPGTVRIPRDPKTNALLINSYAVCLLCGQRYTVPAVADTGKRLVDFQLSLVAKSVTRTKRS